MLDIHTRFVSTNRGTAPNHTEEELPMCQVCGFHDLVATSPHTSTAGLPGRLSCRRCGAHRILGNDRGIRL